MHKNWLLSVALAVALGSQALAQQQDRGKKVGDWAPDLDAVEWLNIEGEDELPSLARYRGLCVVVFFWTSWHDGGKFILPNMNLLATHEQLGTAGGVVLIGMTDADAKSTKRLLIDTKVLFPVGVGSKKVAQELGFEDSWGIVVIDTEGKLAYKGQPQGDGFVQSIVEILRKAPPFRTHPIEAKKVVSALDQARLGMIQRKYKDVWHTMSTAFQRTVTGDKLKSEVFAYEDLVDQMGYLQIRDAELLVEKGEYAKAADILRQLHRRCKNFDVGRDAGRKIDQLSKEHDGFKQALTDYTTQDAAYKLLLAAREDLKQKRVGEAHEKLAKITAEYSTSEAAALADQHLSRMKAIPEVWTEVLNYRAKADCTAWLQQARSFLGQGKKREAEELLRRVLNDHPGTSYAAEAKDMLINMR